VKSFKTTFQGLKKLGRFKDSLHISGCKKRPSFYSFIVVSAVRFANSLLKNRHQTFLLLCMYVRSIISERYPAGSPNKGLPNGGSPKQYRHGGLPKQHFAESTVPRTVLG
jgi:hypothetical protein